MEGWQKALSIVCVNIGNVSTHLASRKDKPLPFHMNPFTSFEVFFCLFLYKYYYYYCFLLVWKYVFVITFAKLYIQINNVRQFVVLFTGLLLLNFSLQDLSHLGRDLMKVVIVDNCPSPISST